MISSTEPYGPVEVKVESLFFINELPVISQEGLCDGIFDTLDPV